MCAVPNTNLFQPIERYLKAAKQILLIHGATGMLQSSNWKWVNVSILMLQHWAIAIHRLSASLMPAMQAGSRRFSELNQAALPFNGQLLRPTCA